MNRLKKQGFTLVELVVVVTILAILGTIAFITLEGYSADARDSTRLSDISSLKTSLELFNLDAGKYPKPTNGVDITYLSTNVWNQGNFGETVFANVSRLDKIPVDPISEKEYTYSVLNNGLQYQLGGIIEGDNIAYNSPLSPSIDSGLFNYKTEASDVIVKAYVAGNYNGQMTKSLNGTTCSILAIPSIITYDTTTTDLQEITLNNGFVYSGYNNLPSSFKGSKFKYDGGFDFAPNNLVAYSDSGSCEALTSSSTVGTEARVSLIKGLQDAYSGTLLKNEGEISNITSLSIDTGNPSPQVIAFAGTFVNNVLGGSISTNSVTSGPEYVASLPVTGGGYFDIIQDVNFANVGALLRMNETTLKDEVGNAVTLYGNTTRSSTQSKYGGYSAYFDGAGDSLTIGSAASVTGLGDFTVEYWMNPTAFGSSYRCQLTNVTSGGFGTCVNSNGTITFGRSLIATDGVTTNTINFGQWNHVAVSRSSGTLKIFINGVEGLSVANTTSYSAGNIRVGTDGGGSAYPYQGYIDDLRITKGVARYTSNFTPPTQEFTKENYRMSGVSANATTTSATSCKYYNLNSTTLNDGTARGSGTCGNGSQACLSNGTYLIDPDGAGGNDAFDIYCDMNTDGGGWSLFTNVFGGTLNDDKMGGNLSQVFIFPFAQTDSLKSLSTEIRYSCKSNTKLIDIKSSNSLVFNRPTEYGDGCTQGYNWAPSPIGYTNLPDNNFAYSNGVYHSSCCCRPSYKLNSYPNGIHWSHWSMVDRYYYNGSNASPSCAGGAADYMRVWYK